MADALYLFILQPESFCVGWQFGWDASQLLVIAVYLGSVGLSI